MQVAVVVIFICWTKDYGRSDDGKMRRLRTSVPTRRFTEKSSDLLDYQDILDMLHWINIKKLKVSDSLLDQCKTFYIAYTNNKGSNDTQFSTVVD